MWMSNRCHRECHHSSRMQAAFQIAACKYGKYHKGGEAALSRCIRLGTQTPP